MIVVPMPMPMDSADLRRRVAELERSLIRTTDLLQTLIERLEARFGEEFFGDRNQSARTLLCEQQAREFVEQIENQVKQGQQPAAVRNFREEFGLTWDQAASSFPQWNQLPPEQKRRNVQLNRWIKLTSQPGS